MNPLPALNLRKEAQETPGAAAGEAEPCVLVIFGASGDLTKRLLVPALYNLRCDGLLGDHFAIIGLSMDALTTDDLRDRLSTEIRKFETRRKFDEPVWTDFVRRVHYVQGKFDDPEAFARLKTEIARVAEQFQTGPNILFYLATPPSVFALVARMLDETGLRSGEGWRRLIVEKPIGSDLKSAIELNRVMLAHWSENQIYRIDHYLGKETVQNLLTFRFSNGVFESLWNKHFVDHIQFTVSETVGVEARGRYYEKAGVLRDMIQNHMFQMLAYLCMEPPTSFRADAVRNEKAKVLDAVRIMRPGDVHKRAVRGQYGPGRKSDGTPAAGYRQEPDVDPRSGTETFAALKLYIDNWRWDGVPIYVRSGKSLWKRGTEILVQFKRAPDVLFRGTPGVDRLASNQLLFHIQPDQGIEFRFQAKAPGPTMQLQKVNMRFDYTEAFEADRGTGYETLIYCCMMGDQTLFSRSDLVESAWRVAQPILDVWAQEPAQDFPNYAAGSWGPKAAFELIEHDGRKWLEVVNREALEKVPLFQGCSPVFLYSLTLMLKPVVHAAGDTIIRKGESGREMFFIARGQVDVLDGDGKLITQMREGDYFGETSLLLTQTRTATVRATTECDLFVLEKYDFKKVLREHPQLAETIHEVSRSRYSLSLKEGQLFDPHASAVTNSSGVIKPAHS